MNWRSFGWLLILVLTSTVPVRATSPNDPTPPIVALGNDSYVITRGAKFFYFRNTEKLAARARADAQKFCHDMGKEMKELSVEEIKAGLLIGDFAKAKITFKALAPGNPALTEANAGPVSGGGGDLTKLDELHRGGVLTDQEFDAAKKRLAEHSLQELHDKGVLSDQEFEAARKRLNER